VYGHDVSYDYCACAPYDCECDGGVLPHAPLPHAHHGEVGGVAPHDVDAFCDDNAFCAAVSYDSYLFSDLRRRRKRWKEKIAQ